MAGLGRRRTLEVERDITRHAARYYADTTAIIEHAEIRAGGVLSREYVEHPMLIMPGRNRLRDVREELADGRNHLVWWLEENLEDETRDRKIEALRHICIAYELVRED